MGNVSKLTRTRVSLALATLGVAAVLTAALIAGALAPTQKASAQVPNADFVVEVSLDRDGVHLSWDFELLRSIPASWRVIAVQVHRAVESTGYNYVKIGQADIANTTEQSLSFTGLSYSDDFRRPFVNASDRDSGSNILYKFRPLLGSTNDDDTFVGKFAGHTTVVVPALPTINGPIISKNDWIYGPYVANWYPPHLSWDSGFNFGSVDGYAWFKNGKSVFEFTPNETWWHAYDKGGVQYISIGDGAGDHPRNNEYSMSVRYGAFFSAPVVFPFGGG